MSTTLWTADKPRQAQIGDKLGYLMIMDIEDYNVNPVLTDEILKQQIRDDVYDNAEDEELEEFLFGEELRAEDVLPILPPLKWTNMIDLGEGIMTGFKRILTKYEKVFKEGPGSWLVNYTIDIGPGPPVKQNAHRCGPVKTSMMKEICTDWGCKGYIQLSDSIHGAACMLVAKRNPDGSIKKNGTAFGHRLVVDFREMNKRIVKIAFPMPRVDDTIMKLGTNRYFSVYDCRSAFNYCMLNPADRYKTAFCTPWASYEFLTAPQGLKNSPAYFSMLMQKAIGHLRGVSNFVDDIVQYSYTQKQHLRDMYKVFEALKMANLTLDPGKSHFFQKKVELLGFVVSEAGVSPNPGKVRAIEKMPYPTTVTAVRSFLGCCGFYRQFIEGYARITADLYKLTRHNESRIKGSIKDQWTDEHRDTVDWLKMKLMEGPIMIRPNFTKQMIVKSDSCGVACGCVLAQEDELKRERVIAYASRTFKVHEMKWDVREKECLSLIWCLQTFRPWIWGRTVKAVVDHKSLVLLEKATKGRLCRWCLQLSEFDLEIVWRPGKKLGDADGLSRNALTTTNLYSGRGLTPDMRDVDELIAGEEIMEPEKLLWMAWDDFWEG
jgi:hypothetical protein